MCLVKSKVDFKRTSRLDLTVVNIVFSLVSQNKIVATAIMKAEIGTTMFEALPGTTVVAGVVVAVAEAAGGT